MSAWYLVATAGLDSGSTFRLSRCARFAATTTNLLRCNRRSHDALTAEPFDVVQVESTELSGRSNVRVPGSGHIMVVLDAHNVFSELLKHW